MRIKITIYYDGTEFFGSQEQSDKITVVGELHSAFQKINIFDKVIMSGRTDRGVHSTGQVFHINIPEYWSLENFIYAFKRVIPTSISFKSATKVSESFHSRFSAKERIYRYIFSTSSANPFESKFVTFIKSDNFDFEKVKESIHIFEGKYNFQNFKKVGSENSSDVREIFKTDAYKFKKYFILKFRANSFLRSQVRLMVGSLLSVGYGKIKEKDIYNLLIGEKSKTNRIAPPNGLFLSKVIY